VTGRRWLAVAGGAALVLVALATLRIALGKALGDRVAERERGRFEREVGPLEPARLAAPAVADADNAVPAVVAAVAAIDLSAAERRLLDCASRCAALAPAPGAELDALLQRQRGALDALRRAAERPASSFGPRQELFHGRRVDSASWLTASRLAAADGERALARGDLARFDAAVATLHGLAVALRREPITVFFLLGEAVERLELDLIRTRVAGAGRLPEASSLAGRVGELARLPAVAQVLHGEAVFALDMLRRTPVVPRGGASPRERLEALLWPWSAGHVEAGQLAGLREAIRFAGRPQAQWPATEAILAARPGRLRVWLDPTAPLDLFGPALMPHLLEIVRRGQQLESAERLAALALDVARRRDATGALPETLAGFAAARPDAVAAELPVYRLEGDGHATLELPTARALLERGRPPAPGERDRAFARRLRSTRWPIPPPAPPAR